MLKIQNSGVGAWGARHLPQGSEQKFSKYMCITYMKYSPMNQYNAGKLR